jgi:hypothetical protein
MIAAAIGFLLSACGQSANNGQPAAPTALNDLTTSTAANTQIPCAPEGAADFTRACAIERTGDTFTVRNPDGGFHRLVMTSDGGVAAADGAEPAQVTTRGRDSIEVTIGGDRYRVPATP